ncbi:hypothetical protein [Citricoccus sp. GCM10030269]|uniref:hypothetical protein n=1 Tax=Citricoccus sp. GCM10030269 TaxID=3273388 RepID=UPI003619C899
MGGRRQSGGAPPLIGDGQIPLLDHVEALRERHGWDYMVYLTDLPRSHDGGPMVCEVSAAAKAALVPWPALGAVRLVARTRKLLATLIGSMRKGTEDYPSAPAARHALGRGAPGAGRGAEDTVYLVLAGRLNQLRLLAGMVGSNQPGRLLPALSTSVATAAATGAFGIFFAPMWNLSDALPLVRLAAISAVVITALSGWLIIHNVLWNRTRHASDPWRAGRDNAATVVTVWLSVGMMYMVLWSVLFTAGLVVIEADDLQSQLKHPVSLLDYGHLSWLAASLGTLAGALGSNFDSEDAIREATYSRREHQRRQLADSHDD